MFYVVRFRGWPALVWLEVRPGPGRYQIVGSFDDVLKAMASVYDAVERARATLVPPPAAGPGARCWSLGPAYDGAGLSNTMSPSPPAAKKRPTYESPT
jgi:hypothetical protein